MKAAVYNEFRKLMLHKKYTVLMIIGLVLGILWSLVGRGLSSFFRYITSSALSVSTASPTGSLWFFSCLVLPLLIFMAVSDLFCGEFSDNTIKASLMRPITRLKLYSAKVLSILTYCGLFLCFVFVINIVLWLIVGDADSVIPVLRAIPAYIMTLLPLLVMILYAAFMAQLIRSSSLLMFVLIASMALINALPLLLPVSRDIFFTSYMGWFNLFTGQLPSFGKMANILALLLGYGATFYIAGTLMFDRRDF